MKPAKRIFAFLLLILAAAAATPASASEVLRAVPAALDPTKGYVLLEIRNHDAGPQKGSVTLARYDPVGHDVRGGTRSPGSALGRGEAVRVVVASRQLAKTDQGRLYLVALEPDTWVIEGVGNTAFSLDSRTFTIAAGQILDLGVLSPRTDWPEGQGPPTIGRLVGVALLGPFARMPDPQPAFLEIRERGSGDMEIPAPIRAAIVPAQFQPGARFGNYLGGLVNRLDGRRGRPGATPVAGEAPASQPDPAPADPPADEPS